MSYVLCSLAQSPLTQTQKDAILLRVQGQLSGEGHLACSSSSKGFSDKFWHLIGFAIFYVCHVLPFLIFNFSGWGIKSWASERIC